MMRHRAAAWMVAAALSLSGGDSFGSIQEQDLAIAIDREVRRVAGVVPLWPGYEPLTIPLAIYTGSATYLFRHPAPPEGFTRVQAGPEVSVLQGRHPAATSNSSADIGGTSTATLLADGSRAGQSPTSLAATALHEAFHVFQRAHHPSWSGNEGDLFLYPVDDARLLALRRLESRALSRALAAAQPDTVACWARLALAYRAERFARMDSLFSTYERRTELNEGLASYVQLRAMGAETVAIPEAEFVATAVRDRIYTIGPALAFLLDRLHPEWKVSLESDDSQNLDALLLSAVGRNGATPPTCSFSGGEVSQHEARAAQEAKVVDTAREQRRTAFDERPGWRVIVECAEGQPLWPQGFDPLNVERVDGGILHARFLKLGNEAGSIQVIDEAEVDLESLTEGAGKHPLFNGIRRVTVTGLAEPQVERAGEQVQVHAPGLTLQFTGATAEVQGSTVFVRLAGEN